MALMSGVHDDDVHQARAAATAPCLIALGMMVLAAGGHDGRPVHAPRRRAQAEAQRRPPRLPALPPQTRTQGPRRPPATSSGPWPGGTRHRRRCGRWSGTTRLWERRPVRTRTSARSGSDRRAAAGAAAHPAGDQAGRGPGAAAPRTRCAGSSARTPPCPTSRSRCTCAPSSRMLLRGDRSRPREPGPGDARPAGRRSTRRTSCGSRCAPAAEPARGVGLGQVAAARPAPARQDARRPGPADAPTRCDELERAARRRVHGARRRFDPDAAPGRDEPYIVLICRRRRRARRHRLDGRRLPQRASVIDLAGALRWRRPTTLRLDVADGDGWPWCDATAAGKEQSPGSAAPTGSAVAGATALARLLAPVPARARPTEPRDALATDLDLTDPARHRRPVPASTRGALWQPPQRRATGCGCRSGSAPTARRSSWTSRSPRRAAWARTACSSAPPAPARASCCARWCSALALTHSSETLNFVLVDFKGGATFLGLDALPHISAVITNLADELPLVDRMQRRPARRAGPPAGAAARGRQLHLGARLRAGPRAGRRRWTRCRACSSSSTSSANCCPRNREFVDLFVMIGRLGRSLGVHLLLASPAAGRGPDARQLETHLSYRIGLRTFSAMECRGVLGVPDAYELPLAPGNGYLQLDTDHADPVQGRVRLRAVPAAGRGAAGTRAGGHRPGRAVHAPATCSPAEPAAGARPGPAAGRRPAPASSLLDMRRRPAARPGPPAAPGLAAAAGRAADPGPRCCPALARRPGPRPARRRLGRRGAPARAASASSTSRSSSAATCCGWTCPGSAATSASPAARRAARAPCCAR